MHTFFNPNNEFPGRILNYGDVDDDFPRRYKLAVVSETPRYHEPVHKRPRTISGHRSDRTTHKDSRNGSPPRPHHTYDRNNNIVTNGNGPSNGVSQTLCEFFTKIHACRFGDACKHKHVQPESSSSIIVKNLFNHSLLMKGTRLSVKEERRLQHDYRRFYQDVIIKFRCVGPLMMVKCARNCGDHLRGNLYVMYSEAKYAKDAVALLNGHVYEGHPMDVQLSNVNNWTAALCGRLVESYQWFC